MKYLILNWILFLVCGINDVRILIFLFKARICFPVFNIRLYDKNWIRLFFFPPPKSEYFFRKKNHSPPPWKLSDPSLSSAKGIYFYSFYNYFLLELFPRCCILFVFRVFLWAKIDLPNYGLKQNRRVLTFKYRFYLHKNLLNRLCVLNMKLFYSSFSLRHMFLNYAKAIIHLICQQFYNYMK